MYAKGEVDVYVSVCVWFVFLAGFSTIVSSQRINFYGAIALTLITFFMLIRFPFFFALSSAL